MYCPQLYHGGVSILKQRALPWSLVFLPRAAAFLRPRRGQERRPGGFGFGRRAARAQRSLSIPVARSSYFTSGGSAQRKRTDHCRYEPAHVAARRRRAPSAELGIGSVHIDIARRVTTITLSSSPALTDPTWSRARVARPCECEGACGTDRATYGRVYQCMGTIDRFRTDGHVSRRNVFYSSKPNVSCIASGTVQTSAHFGPGPCSTQNAPIIERFIIR